MNYAIVVRSIGRILLIAAAAFLLPAAVSVMYEEGIWQYFLLMSGVCLLIGFLMSRCPVKVAKVKAKEGMLIVALSWTLASLLGAFPYYLSEAIPAFHDAFFETVSGFTTTGATILRDIEALPRSLLFWRSLTQWIGGAGILVFTLAILPASDAGSLQIFKAESTGPVTEKFTPKIGDTAKMFFAIYFALTVLQTVLLLFGGMGPFDALLHSLSTISTGGFSNRTLSGGYYDSLYIYWVIITFMILSGINFGVLYYAILHRGRSLLRDEELRFYLGTILVGGVFIAANLLKNGLYQDNLLEGITHSVFQVSSIMTSTGFSTANYEVWPDFAKTLLFTLFFIGGCAGSTSGGIKSIRILAVVRSLKVEFLRVVHPRMVRPVRVNGKPLSSEVQSGIKSFVLLFLVLSLIGTLLISLDPKTNLITSFTACVTALANIGPGLDAVGPYSNYAFLMAPSKYILCFLMLAGRLELYTVLCLFSRSFWKD